MKTNKYFRGDTIHWSFHSWKITDEEVKDYYKLYLKHHS